MAEAGSDATEPVNGIVGIAEDVAESPEPVPDPTDVDVTNGATIGRAQIFSFVGARSRTVLKTGRVMLSWSVIFGAVLTGTFLGCTKDNSSSESEMTTTLLPLEPLGPTFAEIGFDVVSEVGFDVVASVRFEMVADVESNVEGVAVSGRGGRPAACLSNLFLSALSRLRASFSIMARFSSLFRDSGDPPAYNPGDHARGRRSGLVGVAVFAALSLPFPLLAPSTLPGFLFCPSRSRSRSWSRLTFFLRRRSLSSAVISGESSLGLFFFLLDGSSERVAVAAEVDPATLAELVATFPCWFFFCFEDDGSSSLLLPLVPLSSSALDSSSLRIGNKGYPAESRRDSAIFMFIQRIHLMAFFLRESHFAEEGLTASLRLASLQSSL